MIFKFNINIWLLFCLNFLIAKKSSSSSSSSTEHLTRRRIISEWRDISRDNITLNTPFNQSSVDESGVRLSPINNNFLHWHFSFTGVANSSFDGGIYHGRIILNKDYPRKAPSICILTPNGRWEVGKDICLSASSYHQETWDMKWNLRTLVMALRGHMLTQPREIGSISSTPDRHRQFAKLSRYYKCKNCGVSHSFLLGEEPSFELVAPSERNTIPKNNILSRETSKKIKKRKLKTADNILKTEMATNTKVTHPLLKMIILMIPIFIMILSRYLNNDLPSFSFQIQLF